MKKTPHCWAHPTALAVARCHRCNLRLCDTCFRLLAGGEPVCEICALELSGGPASRWPVAVAFVGATVAICVSLARVQMPEPWWGLWAVTIAIAAAIGIAIGLSTPKQASAQPVEITERAQEESASAELLQRAKSPYRARIARAARRVVPLSGRSTALVMFAAFVVSAVALPVGLALPGWVELELVLASWWLGLFGLLSVLLYRNWRLADDHRLKVGALTAAFQDSRSETQDTPGAKRKSRSLRWSDVGTGCGDIGCGSGMGEALVVVLVLVVALAAAWVLVELLLPVLFFLFYYFIVRAIGRVARDQHGCEGRLGPSLLWGAVWASVYVVPVALVTWGAHAVLAVH